ncbi:glutaredoxin 3 [bacterium]|nr:glutaredoxin 3 [bacterium]
MTDIVIYTKDYCPYCRSAKALLAGRNALFTEIDVTHDEQLQAEMIRRSGRRTVPQVFIGGRPVGGSDDLHALAASGELDRLLNGGPMSPVG